MDECIFLVDYCGTSNASFAQVGISSFNIDSSMVKTPA